MGFVVRAKRIDIFDDVINCSFALDFVDSVTLNSLNGIYKVEGGDVLVGCTDKGRLCVQGSAINLDWTDVDYTLQFIDSNGRQLHEETWNTMQILNAPLGDEIDSSDVVGVGKVGFMIVRS